MSQYGLIRPTNEIALRPLRPRQEAAIAAIRLAIRSGKRKIILMLPTGGGKTLIAAHIIAGAIEKGKKSMFTCPAINLVNQTLRAFEAEGIRDIGVIQAQHERTDWQAQTQIASVQTLVRRPLPEVDLVIIDEAHERHEKLEAIILSDAWRDKVVIGLSATPWSKGLGLVWDELIVAATTQQLIEEGWLTPFRIFAPSVMPDFRAMKIKAGEFEDKSTSAEMSKKTIIGDIVKEWQEKAHGLPTFLFCVDRAHAKIARDEFQQAGIGCGYMDGESTPDERRETFKAYRSGETPIIASVGTLITGIDEDVRCIVDAQPTKSQIRLVQKLGRGIRLADGKDSLIILDPAANCLRLGLITDIHHDTLDTRKPGEKGEAYADEPEPPKPRKCKECRAIMPPSAKTCPNCGKVWFSTSAVQIQDGELTEFIGGTKPKKEPKPKRDEKQDFYSGLLYIAQTRGFKDGWVAHKYRTKFGVWPVGLERVPKAPIKAVKEFDAEQTRLYRESKKSAPQVEATA